MKYLSDYPHLGIFLLAFLLADLVTPLVAFVARRWGVVDHPDARKVHTTPVPTLGGLAVYLAFVLSVLSSLEGDPKLYAMLMAGGIIVLVGMLDDLRGVSALLKLFLLAVATSVIIYSGVCLTLFFPHRVLDLFFTLFWVVFLTSGFNAIDNMNGLAPGAACVAAGFLFLLAWVTWNRWLAFLAAGLLGSCLGFLRYNFPRASIFLGDTGSFFLGFILAGMAIMGDWSEVPYKAFLMPAMILGFPIFDLTLTTLLRFRDKRIRTLREAIVHSDRDHISHRLCALGFTPRESVVIQWGLSFLLGAAGWVLRGLSPLGVVVLLGCVGGILLWFGLYVSRAPLSLLPGEDAPSKSGSHASSLFRRIGSAIGSLTPILQQFGRRGSPDTVTSDGSRQRHADPSDVSGQLVAEGVIPKWNDEGSAG